MYLQYIKCYIILTLFIFSVRAWDDAELEVFDVVEEVNQNFYELLGVSQEAAPAEIKSAFKRLTLKLHPDKNDAPDADIQFRNLVSVHNVLKDPGKREKYNEVLKNGLPNWRSAVYYYRHVRKMGLVEMSLILFIIITLGQYVVGWAAYVEKKYTAEQILVSKMKKLQKRGGVDVEISQIIDQLPTPSVKDTLPFQIPRWTLAIFTSLPHAINAYKMHLKDKEEEKKRQEEWEKSEQQRIEHENALLEFKKANTTRKRKGFVPPERDIHLNPADDNKKKINKEKNVESKPAPVVTGGLWTDDDLTELVRLVKKYPSGSSERWERIAETMCRNVGEVTHMAAKLKDNCYRLPAQDPVDITPVEVPKKIKTRKPVDVAAESQSNWSQTQQKALEAGLAKFPKSGSGDRWEKIAKSVPDKTKEECMLRCKYLADLVRKQKQKDEDDSQTDVPSEGNDDESLIKCEPTQRFM